MISILKDIAILPFIRILILSSIREAVNIPANTSRSSIYFISQEREEINAVVKSVEEIKRSEENQTARNDRIQRRATLKTLYCFVTTIFITAAYFVLSESVVPKQKFFIDHNVRSQITSKDAWRVQDRV